MNRTLKLHWAFWLVALSTVAAAITPAGTVIRNQATVATENETYLSNEVNSVVRAICSPSLEPGGSPDEPGQMATLLAGGYAYFSYSLENAGNDSYTFALDWLEHGSSDWSPTDVRLLLDVNGDGQVNPGEPEVGELKLFPGERARFNVEVQAPRDAEGMTLITPQATCPGGERSAENYARAEVRSGPALRLTKTVTPQEVQPGDDVTFSLRITNLGDKPTGGEVVLSDLLNGPDFDKLEYLPRRSSATQGRIEYYDGVRWGTLELVDPEGVRLVIDALEVGEEILFSFAMRVQDGVSPGVRRNRARAEGPGGPVTSQTTYKILPYFSHYLGPEDNARAQPRGEASADDYQFRKYLVSDQPYCFTQSLENAGTADDVYALSSLNLPQGYVERFETVVGTPITKPVPVRRGETFDYRYCVTPAYPGAGFKVTLRATSVASSAVNITFAEVSEVLSGEDITLLKEVDIEGIVGEGETLTYTLTVTNDNPFTLTDLRIVDPLQPLVPLTEEEAELLKSEFVEASDGGVYDPVRHTAVWEFPFLEGGESLSVTLAVRMPAQTPGDYVYTLENEFYIRANQVPNSLLSNAVSHFFPVLGINIQKAASPEQARVGDTVAYEITVSNPNDVVLPLVIADAPPERTQYVADSASASVGEVKKSVEPVLEDGALVWDLSEDEELFLGEKDGERAVLTLSYKLRLLPGAPEELVNTVTARGLLSNGDTRVTVASNESAAKVEVVGGALHRPKATLLGRVYLDVDEDGRYDQDLDVALPGARVVLANGWQSLTDVEGRYSFREIARGPWSVMLDADSAPFEPRPHPEALGAGYRHGLVAEGVTVSDFPLVMPLGLIGASRETVLVFGPLTVTKKLVPLPEGVRVVLHLEGLEPLPELQLFDPVPGADDRLFTFELLDEARTVSYDLPGRVYLTDPNVRWRYP